MTNNFINSRRGLRERAFQALFSLELGGEYLAVAQFAYTYDKAIEEDDTVDVPIFLLNLVKGIQDLQFEIDQQIEAHLKSGRSSERLALIDRTLSRLGLYEIKYFERTPGRVVVNEIIEITKKHSNNTSVKFVNGLLNQFVIE